MAESFGEVLRSLREAASLSLAGLAARTNYHKSEIGHVETGVRRASAELSEACDRVFGTFPLLTMLVEMDEGQGDKVKRRALLATITAAVGVSGIGGATALADVVRHGLLESAGNVEDWDAVVEDYSRRLVTAPTAQFGSSLLSQLMIARQQNVDSGTAPERLKAIAQLGQLYGLWLGNRGDVSAARGWYRSATAIADRSGHDSTRIYVRGRALSRGIYEGYTVRETVHGVSEALSISRTPCIGALEAYSALVHVHGLTGNLAEGRKAVSGMRRVVEGLPGSEVNKVAGPAERTVSFNSYLECRVGSRRDAERAFGEAEPMLRSVPIWHADAKVYYGRALVTDGDVHGGVSFALDAVKSLGHDVRVVGVGISDLLSVVPAKYRADELDELKSYAAAGPGPWETLA